jgi:hypothetical protein
MKKMYVLDASGKKLFAGQRRDCKKFVRDNKLNAFKLTENYVEKVVITKPTVEPEEENELAKAETPEGYFNKVF